MFSFESTIISSKAFTFFMIAKLLSVTDKKKLFYGISVTTNCVERSHNINIEMVEIVASSRLNLVLVS